MSTIYRKYRPQSWADLIGQEHITTTLQKELAMNKMAHAYLFTGPRGSGKTTSARLLAKSLNCEQIAAGQYEPCNTCSSCAEIKNGRSIDVIEIDAASNTGVDNVRENIIESARLLPTKSKNKIFIIDEVHMLSTSAFNALLKIMEEPPSRVYFILATTEPFKIPQTIISRCQCFNFKKVEIEKIVERLKSIAEQEATEIDKKVLTKIAHQSEGCLRDAEGLLGQMLALGEKKITLAEAELVLPHSDFEQVVTLLEFSINKNIRDGILYLNNLLENGVDLIHFTDDLIETVHLLLLTKINSDLPDLVAQLEEEQLSRLKKLALKTTLAEIQKILEVFLKQKLLLKSSSLPQLPLELALLEICSFNQQPAIDNKNNDDFKMPPPPTPKEPEIKKITTEEQIANDTVLVEQDSEDFSLNTTQSTTEITVEAIKNKWLLFIDKIEPLNHSLPFILKMGEPIEVKGNVVRIGFKFALHRDKFNETKIKLMAEKVFNEVFGHSNLFLEGLFLENTATLDNNDKNKDNSVISNLIEEFGGQIIG